MHRKASVRLGSFRFVETAHRVGSVHAMAGSFRFVVCSVAGREVFDGMCRDDSGWTFFPSVCSVEVSSGQNHNLLMTAVLVLFLGLGIMLLIINNQNSYISAVWNEIGNI